MTVGVYPGSFDPVTLGHVDIIKRASKMFDRLIVGVLNNCEKTNAMFDVEERKELLRLVTQGINNVEITSFDGLTVEFAKNIGADCLIRGLRLMTDFEYELQMAHSNKELNDNIETVFLVTNKEYSFISSTTAKDIARYGGELKSFVPESIINIIKEKARGNK